MANQHPEDVDCGYDRHLAERYLTEPAMNRQMPEHSRDPEIALALLESEVLLDGDPMKNLATFVTTYMEPERGQGDRRQPPPQLHRPRRVSADRRDLQALRADAPPPLQRRRRARGARHGVRRLVGGRDARRAGHEVALEEAREKAGKPADKPNLVYGADVHVVWDKFCRYFDVEPRQVPSPEGSYVVGADEFQPHIDENTIGVVAVVGTTFTGDCDDVVGIDAMLASSRATGSTCRCTSTPRAAASCSRSRTRTSRGTSGCRRSSRSTSPGHKFGLVYPGVGWLVFRDDDQLPGGPRLLRGLPRRARRDVHAELLRQLVVRAGPVLQLHPPRARGLRVAGARDEHELRRARGAPAPSRTRSS